MQRFPFKNASLFHFWAFVAFGISFSTQLFASSDQDICQRLSDAAKITGTSVMFLTFEGLMGFNPGASKQADVYRCQLSNGLPATKPGSLFGGKVLQHVVLPVIEKYKNRVLTLNMAHDAVTGQGSMPEHCAMAWMKGAAGRKVYIAGHSFGGHAAHMLAHNLSARGVQVAGVFTIDPRKRPAGTGGFHKSSTAEVWKNYYQVIDLVMRGWPVSEAENILLPAIPGIGHINLPSNSKIIQDVFASIGDPPGSPVYIAGNTGVNNASIEGSTINNRNSVDPNLCSASKLAESGLYKGTAGSTEFLPVAGAVAAVGTGAYLLSKKGKDSSGLSGTRAASHQEGKGTVNFSGIAAARAKETNQISPRGRSTTEVANPQAGSDEQGGANNSSSASHIATGRLPNNSVGLATTTALSKAELQALAEANEISLNEQIALSDAYAKDSRLEDIVDHSITEAGVVPKGVAGAKEEKTKKSAVVLEGKDSDGRMMASDIEPRLPLAEKESLEETTGPSLFARVSKAYKRFLNRH